MTARLAGQAALAVALAARHRRRAPVGPVVPAGPIGPMGPMGPVGRPRAALALLVAASSPLAAALVAARRNGRPRWPSPAGLGLLAAHAASAAVCEELLWRAPLLRLRAGPGRAAVATLAGGGFVGLHLRRDGAAALPVHALNTAAWTAATLLGRRLRWPVLAHATYDLLALTLRTGAPAR